MPPRPPPPVTSTGTQSFFVGAPLTKLASILAVVAYFSTSTTKGSNNNHVRLFAMDALRVYEKGEIYRYVTAPMTFGTTAELIPAGLLLVYSLRQVEREMSTRKCTMFVLFVHGFAIVCQALMIPYLLYAAKSNLRYAGPYALLGALFYHFHVKTPRITPQFVRILGFSFSDKLWQYLWFAQAAGGGGWSTLLIFAIGTVAAWIYDKVPWLSQGLDVPDVVTTWVSTVVGFRFWADGPPRTVLPGRAGRGGGGGIPRAAAAAAAAPPPRAVTADPAAVEQLTMMGFPQPRVVEALQATNNDVQRAADRLLTQS